MEREELLKYRDSVIALALGISQNYWYKYKKGLTADKLSFWIEKHLALLTAEDLDRNIKPLGRPLGSTKKRGK